MLSNVKSIAYYITAHGYGHGARSCDIIAALLRKRPDLPIHVVSDLPESFLAPRLPPGPVHFRPGSFDVGMVQLDSIRVDVPATLHAARRLLAGWPQCVDEEVSFLRSVGAGWVVADIPGVPLQAARRMGLPALAVGNFSWSWIYEPFAEAEPGWRPVIEAYREAYGQADLLLRLPFHEPMVDFPRQLDLSLVARPGIPRREEIARYTGADPSTTWALLSFSTLDWDGAALDRVASIPGHTFFTVKPLAWDRPGLVALDRRAFPYADVLASCDLVVTKPGFGVMQEAAVNGKTVVYAEREDFREYPVLEAALKRHFRSVHLPARQLYRGELGDALAAARTAPGPLEPLPAGGDEQAAKEILGRL